MFFGEYEHSIDDKSRLTLPARFRDSFGSGVVLARGLEKQVDVYPRDGWLVNIETRLAELDPLSRQARELRRFFYAGMADTELDKQGRVLVPPALVRHASLGKDVVIAGVFDHLEIWERDAWASHVLAVEGSADDVAERLAEQR